MPTTTITTMVLTIRVSLVFVLWLPIRAANCDETTVHGIRGDSATCSTTLVTAETTTTRSCLPTNECPTRTRLPLRPVFVPTRNTDVTSTPTKTVGPAEDVVCTPKGAYERRTLDITIPGTAVGSPGHRASPFAEAIKKHLPSNPMSAECESSCRRKACPCMLGCNSCLVSGTTTSRMSVMSFVTLIKDLLKPSSKRPKSTPRFVSSTRDPTNTPFTHGWNPLSTDDQCVAVIATNSSLPIRPTSP